MDFDLLFFSPKSFSSMICYSVAKCIVVLITGYLIWSLVSYIYDVVAEPSGIHYVNLERQPLQMTTTYNPFLFEADYSTAGYSGIKCVLKCEQLCYVQALWGVPIYSLFELLGKDWQGLVKPLITDNRSEKFCSKCMYGTDPFQLLAGEEKTIEFKPPCHINETMFSQGRRFLREVYPFVVLMVLIKRSGDIPERPGPFVIAMANVIHVPDENLLLHPQLIGQFIKVSSGHIGQIKSTFQSSAILDDEGYDLCVVCYHRPVSVVILPCRHSCVCRVCFDLCERCPVCRAVPFSFFEFSNAGEDSNH